MKNTRRGRTIGLTALLAFSSLSFGQTAQDLKIDFGQFVLNEGNVTVSLLEDGFQAYNAQHEVTSTFNAQQFNAFGSMVTLTPVFATTDRRTQQSLDRPAANDNNWRGTQLALLTDFIGVDTRTGSGGNGNYAVGDDAANQSPLDFLLEGVPAGTYVYESYHHDNENVWASFLVSYSVDGGTTFTPVMGPGENGEFTGTNAATNSGNPVAPTTFQGSTGSIARGLPSATRFGITSTGGSITIRYIPVTDTAVHRQIFVCNGFELAVDSDGDLLPDAYETANNLMVGTADGATSADSDQLTNLQELSRATDPNDNDTDDDGLDDHLETDTGVFVSVDDRGTNPRLNDTDGDTLLDGVENPTLPFVDANQPGTSPVARDSDFDFYTDDYEVANGGNPTDEAIFPLMDGLWVDFSLGGNEILDQQYQAAFFNNGDLADFRRERSFPGFGTNITLRLGYPGNPDMNARAFVRPERGYDGTDPDLIRDGIFLTARDDRGGNGASSPSTLTFEFGNLPAGNYIYRGFHHDFAGFVGAATILVSDAMQDEDSEVIVQQTTNVSNTKQSAVENPGMGNSAEALSSTVDIPIVSNGTDSVAIIYRMTAFDDLGPTDANGDRRDAFVFQSEFFINGFKLLAATPTTPPATSPAVGSIVLGPGADQVTLTFGALPANTMFQAYSTTDLTGNFVTPANTIGMPFSGSGNPTTEVTLTFPNGRPAKAFVAIAPAPTTP